MNISNQEWSSGSGTDASLTCRTELLPPGSTHNPSTGLVWSGLVQMSTTMAIIETTRIVNQADSAHSAMIEEAKEIFSLFDKVKIWEDCY